MQNIHSFLQGVKKALKTDCYKTFFMIMAYSMAAILLVLSSDSFYGTGSSVGYSYAQAQTISYAVQQAEETAQDAQIQPEKNEKQEVTLENRTIKMLKGTVGTGTAFGQEEQINHTIKVHKLQALRLMEQKELTEQRRLDYIAEQKAKEEKLAKAKAKAAEEKRIAKEKAAKEAEERKVKLPSDEIKVLQRIVEAEATGEDIKGKMLVANVILNRVKSSAFPDSVSKVVFQKNGSTYQFSPIKDGRYWDVRISKDTEKAVNRVLSGEDESQGALYFSARSKADKRSMSWFDNHLTWLFQYGGHEFYR